jgi:hypothetical protein
MKLGWSIIALVIGIFAGSIWEPAKILPALAAQKNFGTHAVPKSWGKLLGVGPGGFVFEATDGTVRVFDPNRSGDGITVTLTRTDLDPGGSR